MIRKSTSWLCGILFIVGIFAAMPQPVRAADRPHFVIVMTDDQSFREFIPEYMPKTWEHVVYPGTLFNNAWYNVSLCCPSRANFMTGKYAQNTGVFKNSYTQFAKNGNEAQTFAVELARLGYVNILAGKYMNGYNGRSAPPGWTRWNALNGVSSLFYDVRVVDENGKRTAVTDYTTDYYFARAIEDATQALREGKPTLTFVGVSAPHTPATPARRHLSQCDGIPLSNPPSYNNTDAKRAAYQRVGPFTPDFEAGLTQRRKDRICTLKAVDEGVDRLVKLYESYGQGDNTYFIVTSDNGISLGEHGLTSAKATPNREASQMMLAIRGPDIRPRSRVEHLVGMADLMPTIVELAGGTVPSWVDSRSLVPLWDASPPPLEDFRRALPAQLRTSQSSVRIPSWQGVITLQGQTYAEYPGLKGTGDVWREFFDRERFDPYERENLIDDQPASVKAYFREITRSLNRCAGEACRELDISQAPETHPINDAFD